VSHNHNEKTGSHVSHYNHTSQQSALKPREQSRVPIIAAMLSALSTDECMGIVFMLVAITMLLAPRRCLSYCYTLLAWYHELIALLAGTEVFIFFIFLSILVADFCHAIIRTIKPLVLATLGMSVKSNTKTASNSATYATNPQLAPVNKQLRDYIREDAEKFWKDKGDARDKEAHKTQELRNSYRELVTQQPGRQIREWSLFEMEARGAIGL
jgi:hypothetical protein